MEVKKNESSKNNSCSCSNRRKGFISNETFYCLVLVPFIFTNSLALAEHKDLTNQRPHQIRSEILNATSVRLRWVQPRTEPFCPTRRYMIRLKESVPIDPHSKSSNDPRSWKFNSTHTSATVHGLKANTEYLVRVVAENCQGKWKTSPWVALKTSGTISKNLLDRSTKDLTNNPEEHHHHHQAAVRDVRAPGTPVDVRSTAYADSVFVSWQAPAASEIGGTVRGYMIGYGEGVPDVNWRYLEGNQRNITIKNLKKATQYVISVTAYNDFGKSPVIYDLVYTSDNTGPLQRSLLPPPTDLRVKIISSTSVRLQWTDTSLGRLQEIKDGRYYNVHYRSIPEGKAMSILVKDLHIVLTDLIPSTKYEFKIRTIKEEQMSPFSTITANRTLDDDDDDDDEEDEDDDDEEDEDGRDSDYDPTTPLSVSHSFQYQRRSKEDAAQDQRRSKSSAAVGDMKSKDTIRDDGRREYIRDRKEIRGFYETGSLVRDGKEEVRAKDNKKQQQQQDQQPSSTSQPSPGKKKRVSSRDSLPAIRSQSMVYHKIAAFITWPQSPRPLAPSHGGCTDEDAAGTDLLGYRLRYHQQQVADTDDDVIDYITRNLTSNFILLEDLLPDSKYYYQIQYIMGGKDGNSGPTMWSREEIIDTHYSTKDKN